MEEFEGINPSEVEFKYTNPSPFLQANPEYREHLEETYTELTRELLIRLQEMD